MTVKGWDLTLSNVGRPASVALTDVTGVHYSSDYASDGTPTSRYAVTPGKRYRDSIFQDTDYNDYSNSYFDKWFQNKQGGVDARGTKFSYCTFMSDGPVGPQAIDTVGYSVFRCKIVGHSDGLRMNGGLDVQYAEESIIRVKLANSADHNDGIQSERGSGAVVIRACYIDMRPADQYGNTISNGTINADGCVLMADFLPNTTFTGTITDSLLHPGAAEYTLKLLDGNTNDGKDIRYVVTGNRLYRGTNGYLDRSTTPADRIVWENNVDAVTGALIPLP